MIAFMYQNWIQVFRSSALEDEPRKKRITKKYAPKLIFCNLYPACDGLNQ